MLTVDALAQEIRRVDGSNSLGAGALAEALMPFLSRAPSPSPAPEVVRVDDARGAISAAIWNEFLYGIDTVTWSGAFARSLSLDDADKLAKIALAALASLSQPAKGERP